MVQTKRGKTQRSSAYVVDACFARAVGEAKSARAIRCHELLARILIGEHICAFNKALRDEWTKHSSNACIAWLTSLVSKKLYQRDDDAKSAEFLKALQNAKLSDEAEREETERRSSKALQNTKLSEKAEREIEKDAHILHLCLCHGKRLITFEKQLQLYLKQNVALAVIAKQIEWIADEPHKIPVTKAALAKFK